jgi:hypothetical protein
MVTRIAKICIFSSIILQILNCKHVVDVLSILNDFFVRECNELRRSGPESEEQGARRYNREDSPFVTVSDMPSDAGGVVSLRVRLKQKSRMARSRFLIRPTCSEKGDQLWKTRHPLTGSVTDVLDFKIHPKVGHMEGIIREVRLIIR